MSSQLSRQASSGIPRYLYRVYSVMMGDSNVLNSDVGFASAAARNNDCHPSLADMQYGVAQAKLRKHLAWTKYNFTDDEFISWTSSLLWALQFAVRKTTKSAEHELKLCVLDTSRFHTGTFLPAPQLIHDFGLSESNDITNAYHNTEYLVHGSLNVRNCSSTVSLACLRECGLFDLMPELDNEYWKQKLLMRVQYLREKIVSAVNPLTTVTCQRALRVASPFGGEWTMAMTIAFLALRGSPRNLEVLLPLIREVAVPRRDFLDLLRPCMSHYLDAPELANFANLMNWGFAQIQKVRLEEIDGLSQLNTGVNDLSLGSDGVANTTNDTPETTSAENPSPSTPQPTPTRAPRKMTKTTLFSTPIRVIASSLQVRFRDVQYPDLPTGVIEDEEDDDPRATDRFRSAAIPLGSGGFARRITVSVEFSDDACGGEGETEGSSSEESL